MTDSSWHDEIALREASLVDAAREHAAGELDDDTYAAIVAREEIALAALRARTPQAAAPRAPKPRRRRKTSRLVVGLACLSAAAVGIVWLNVSLRQAGSQVTGGIQASTGQRVTQLLLEAQADSAVNNDTAALAAYQTPLAWALGALGFACIELVMLGSSRRLELKQSERYGADSAYQAYARTTPILFPLTPLYTLRNLKVFLG